VVSPLGGELAPGREASLSVQFDGTRPCEVRVPIAIQYCDGEGGWAAADRDGADRAAVDGAVEMEDTSKAAGGVTEGLWGPIHTALWGRASGSGSGAEGVAEGDHEEDGMEASDSSPRVPPPSVRFRLSMAGKALESFMSSGDANALSESSGASEGAAGAGEAGAKKGGKDKGSAKGGKDKAGAEKGGAKGAKGKGKGKGADDAPLSARGAGSEGGDALVPPLVYRGPRRGRIAAFFVVAESYPIGGDVRSERPVLAAGTNRGEGPTVRGGVT